MKKTKEKKVVNSALAALECLGYRIKACLMIAASEPRRGRVVDRHLSKKAEELIRKADRMEEQ